MYQSLSTIHVQITYSTTTSNFFHLFHCSPIISVLTCHLWFDVDFKFYTKIEQFLDSLNNFVWIEREQSQATVCFFMWLFLLSQPVYSPETTDEQRGVFKNQILSLQIKMLWGWQVYFTLIYEEDIKGRLSRSVCHRKI